MSDMMPGQPGDTNPSAADRLRTMIRSHSSNMTVWTRSEAQSAIAAYRDEVLREAIEAARGEYLTDATGTDEDTAYNQGVTDAITAICKLIEGAQR